MTIFLSSTAIGYDRNVIVDDDSVTFTQATLEGPAWHLDAHAFQSLHRVAAASGQRIRCKPDDNRVSWWENFNTTVRYDHVLGRTAYLRYVKDLIADCKALSECDNYYTTQYQVQNKLLDCLAPVFIDKTAADKIENRDSLSLVADDTGMCEVAAYDNFGSSTGRMSVKAGPKILTMSKETRHVFKSRWGKEGVLLSVDFNALEPRVIMTLMGKTDLPADIYQVLGDEAGASHIDRPTLKLMVLAILYGMSRRNFIVKFVDVPDVDVTYDRLLAVLGVKKILGKIKDQMQDGAFTNYYGRHLKCDNESLMVNHYTQSTAVDVACDGFLRFVQDCEDFVTPVFLLHDEIIIDVKKDDVNKVKEYTTQGLYIPSLDTRFHTTTKVFNARKDH